MISHYHIILIFLYAAYSVGNFNIKLIQRNRTFPKYEKWTLNNVSSSILCSWKSLQDKYCVSVLYSYRYKICICLRSTFRDLLRQTSPTTIMNYNLYKTDRAAPKLGSTCETGQDCISIPAADCYSHQCRCQIGHAPHHHSCRSLSECRQFTNRFEAYKSVVVPRKEGRKFPLSSRRRCQNRCLRKHRSPCKSFDIDDDDNCYLQLETIFDVHPERASVCDHYQRICNW